MARIGRLAFTTVLGLLALPGCDHETSSDQGASDVASGASAFADDLVKVATFAPGTLEGRRALRDAPLTTLLEGPADIAANRFVPVFLKACAGDDSVATTMCSVRFVDLQGKTAAPDPTELAFGTAAKRSLSGDETWLLFQRDNDTFVLPTTQSPTGVEPFPLTTAAGGYRDARWVGKHTLVLEDVAKGELVGVDPSTKAELWRIKRPSETPSFAATTDDAHVLVYGNDAATLVTTTAGAAPVYTTIENWKSKITNEDASSCDQQGVPKADKEARAQASPTGKSFLVVSHPRGYTSVVASVSLDGALTVHDACARQVSSFTSDGRFAYEPYPTDEGAPSQVHVHGEASDVVVSGLSYKRIDDDKATKLRFSADGAWIESVDPGGVVSSFAPSTEASAARVLFPDNKTPKGELLAGYALTPAHDKVVLVVDGGDEKRVDVLDLKTNKTSAVLKPWKAPGLVPIQISDAGTDPVVFVESARKLVRLDGTVAKSWPKAADFTFSVGWANNVFYYTANGQLRGVSPDGKVDVAIGPAADDIAVKSGDGKLASVLLQSKDDVFLFTPGTYLAKADSPPDGGPKPQKPAGINANSSPISASAQPVSRSESGCNASPASPSGTRLGLALVALSAWLRRRRARSASAAAQ
jgi:hypothetical protein